MYTASLYCSLISLISNIDVKDAIGKRIGLFSYGSGIASTLFAIKVTGGLSQMVQKIDLMRRLDQRHIATPDEFDAACALREKAYGAKDFVPIGDISNFAADTYYLEGIDEMFRRTYAIKK
ncbi:hydroxymethylglutaryl-CoA synthase, partial [Metarhizium majus ARSEF 297]